MTAWNTEEGRLTGTRECAEIGAVCVRTTLYWDREASLFVDVGVFC